MSRFLPFSTQERLWLNPKATSENGDVNEMSEDTISPTKAAPRHRLVYVPETDKPWTLTQGAVQVSLV